MKDKLISGVTMKYWLVKSDPDTYSIEDLKKEKKTVWDGVRNYQARNNLMDMQQGDSVLFYHSQTEKSVVGIASVSKEHFQDPTTEDNRWVAVELKFEKKLKKSISLDSIIGNPNLSEIGLVRQQRLSVMPLTQPEYEEILSNE